METKGEILVLGFFLKTKQSAVEFISSFAYFKNEMKDDSGLHGDFPDVECTSDSILLEVENHDVSYLFACLIDLTSVMKMLVVLECDEANITISSQPFYYFLQT